MVVLHFGPTVRGAALVKGFCLGCGKVPLPGRGSHTGQNSPVVDGREPVAALSVVINHLARPLAQKCLRILGSDSSHGVPD